MKIRVIVLPVVAAVCLFSCKEDKKQMIVKNWHAIQLDFPKMDEMVAEQQHFIDTVGTSTNAASNIQLYGTSNIDSLKGVLKLQLDTFKEVQASTLTSTWFNFKKNGIATLTYNGTTDSTKWRFNEDGTLELDEMQGQGSGIKMKVLQLSDTILKLEFNENNMNSTITFRPDKN